MPARKVCGLPLILSFSRKGRETLRDVLRMEEAEAWRRLRKLRWPED
jgi:hypothetical protein